LKILNREQMRKIENDAMCKGKSQSDLIEDAGIALSQLITKCRPDKTLNMILFLIGSGNNGSDGLVCAYFMKKQGYNVCIGLLKSRNASDVFILRCIELEIQVIDFSKPLSCVLLSDLISITAKSTVIVDAVLGIGLSRSITGDLLHLMNIVNANITSNHEVFAIDIPSGVDSDSGEFCEGTIKATTTIALGYPKFGHCNPKSKHIVGNLEILDIGLQNDVKDLSVNYMCEENVKDLLPLRPLDSNKGTFGRSLLLGGSATFAGAIALAASACYRAGAGLVTVAIPDIITNRVTSIVPEATVLTLNSDNGEISTHKENSKYIYDSINLFKNFSIGCGLGTNRGAYKIVRELLFSKSMYIPCVIDADGLNVFAKSYKWWEQFAVNAIITPHPKEMSRLTGLTIEHIQSNRIEVIKEYSIKWHKTIVLKGANTLIACPNGEIWLNPISNPLLASAGTGDVLTGLISGLLSQGLTLKDAAILGVYIHTSAAGLQISRFGTSGMLASDLLMNIPIAMNNLRGNNTG
jgi:NAD(P)H-hydrate epimerase